MSVTCDIARDPMVKPQSPDWLLGYDVGHAEGEICEQWRIRVGILACGSFVPDEVLRIVDDGVECECNEQETAT